MAIALPVDSEAFSAPITFELDRGAIEKLHVQRVALGVGSVSEVVREALLRFDFSQFNQQRQERQQLSARISPEQKQKLLETARRANVSQAVLLRAALEQLNVSAPRANPTNTTMPTKKTAAKKAVKQASAPKAAKKATAKKAVKKTAATKKVAVKKTVTKKATKKTATKKAATPAVVVKKAAKKAAKKAPVKKAAVKKVAAKKAAKKASRRT